MLRIVVHKPLVLSYVAAATGELNNVDKEIIKYLQKKKLATTTEIASGIGLQNPETVGRVIVWKRIKKIVKVSNAREGAPLIVKVGRKWAINTEDFSISLSIGAGEELEKERKEEEEKWEW
jgi:DNA-binding Lrp family transcriptional regulator